MDGINKKNLIKDKEKAINNPYKIYPGHKEVVKKRTILLLKNNPCDGDSITIEGVKFVFGKEIEISIDLRGTLNNLIECLAKMYVQVRYKIIEHKVKYWFFFTKTELVYELYFPALVSKQVQEDLTEVIKR